MRDHVAVIKMFAYTVMLGLVNYLVNTSRSLLGYDFEVTKMFSSK